MTTVKEKLGPSEPLNMKAWRIVNDYAECSKAVERMKSAKLLMKPFCEADRQWKRALKERPRNKHKIRYYLTERNEICTKFWRLLKEANDIQIEVDVNIHGKEIDEDDRPEPV